MLTMKEEIRKLKEEAERYEELKLVAEFHTFCANFSRADEAAIFAERWRIPPASFNAIAYFVMPSGETYSSNDLKHNNNVHSTPPLSDAVRRGSSYASHASVGGSGGVSSGGSTSIASPFRRDSAMFSELKGQSRREGSLDPFDYHVSKAPNAETSGLGIAGERDDRWARIAESPRQMSPVSDERTSMPLRPPPKPTPQRTPPLTPRPADVITKPLAVTLEEVFHGTEKRVRIDRQIVDVWTGSTRTEPKQLKVPIKPGLKAGSKIKFAGAGSQGMDGVAQDIWFILEDKRHSIFKRTGSDLEATLALTYDEAMFGWRKEIWTICGRKLRIKGPKNTPSDWKRIYHGFGMPRSSDPSKRGDLIVNVDIQAVDHPGVV
ncbi:hypothetical protein B0J12DRAFT_321767 [Macrophomina phaseolina]|uniref:Chaperone DnaJ C-terminal domain-containing protein n=1 Tax=Macrophomina phaseolina TaxID=35725 RepID=A0ABQ8FYP1_9PEZI|nr:hypothetical protein B0J12DRAFT_321767 [Macrophomina phaseolina]